jgi:hypothetical protein
MKTRMNKQKAIRTNFVLLFGCIILIFTGIAVFSGSTAFSETEDDIDLTYNDIDVSLGALIDEAVGSTDLFDEDEIEKFNKFKEDKDRSKRTKNRVKAGGGLKQVGKKKDYDKAHKNDPDEYESDVYEDFNGSLKDLDKILKKAKVDLNSAKASKAFYTNVKMSDNFDRCNDLVEVSKDLRLAVAALKGGKVGAQLVLDSCSAISGQDFGGFNVQAVCAIPAVAVGVIDTILVTMEHIDEVDSASLEADCMDQIDNTNKSTKSLVVNLTDIASGNGDGIGDLTEMVDTLTTELEELNGLVKDLKNSINDLNDRMDDLEGHIDDKLSDLNDLLETEFQETKNILNTPHGQREGFPLKEIK